MLELERMFKCYSFYILKKTKCRYPKKDEIFPPRNDTKNMHKVSPSN